MRGLAVFAFGLAGAFLVVAFSFLGLAAAGFSAFSFLAAGFLGFAAALVAGLAAGFFATGFLASFTGPEGPVNQGRISKQK